MEKFTIWLSSAIFIVLITGFVQYVIADDATLIGVDIIPTKDSELQVHLQVVIRDSQGQLVSVTESTSGWTTIALQGKTIPGIVMIDDKKVTDHHAIIPTDKTPDISRLSDQEKNEPSETQINQ